MAGVLVWTHRPPELIRLVLFYGVAQVLVSFNNTYAALLHAVGSVDGLSLLNVASKAFWALGVAVGFAGGAGIECVAWAFIASEALKMGALAPLARHHLDLRWQVNWRETRNVIVASLPFFINLLALTVSAKLDVIFLELKTSPREVGWYGAAANVAGLALLLTPLMGWVLLPMSSRAAQRSEEHLFALLRRALEGVLSVAIPCALMLALGAEWICSHMFGVKFAPAAGSLRILAPMFVLTYVAMLSATTLIRQERGWTVTYTSIFGLCLNITLNSLLVTPCLEHFGPGGGGIGAAISLITTEATVTGVLLSCVGKRAFDRRNLSVLMRTAAVCAAVCAFDTLLQHWSGVRLLLDAALYLGLIVAVGAVQTHEVARFVRQAMRRAPVEDGARNATP
jgi:O-antigen/teichoic acid export membrane protein